MQTKGKRREDRGVFTINCFFFSVIWGFGRAPIMAPTIVLAYYDLCITTVLTRFIFDFAGIWIGKCSEVWETK